MRKFMVKTVAVIVPPAISNNVVLGWVRENYSQVHAQIIEAGGQSFLSVEAFDHFNAATVLDDLENNYALLLRRTAA